MGVRLAEPTGAGGQRREAGALGRQANQCARQLARCGRPRYRAPYAATTATDTGEEPGPQSPRSLWPTPVRHSSAAAAPFATSGPGPRSLCGTHTVQPPVGKGSTGSFPGRSETGRPSSPLLHAPPSSFCFRSAIIPPPERPFHHPPPNRLPPSPSTLIAGARPHQYREMRRGGGVNALQEEVEQSFRSKNLRAPRATKRAWT